MLEALELVVAWYQALGQSNVQLPEGASVDIYDDFSLQIESEADMRSLIQMRLGGELSQETFLREAKRRALLGDHVKVEEEIEEKQAEAESP